VVVPIVEGSAKVVLMGRVGMKAVWIMVGRQLAEGEEEEETRAGTRDRVVEG